MSGQSLSSKIFYGTIFLILEHCLTGIIRLRHEFLFTMKICIKSLIISSIYANEIIIFDVVPTPHNPPLGRNTSHREQESLRILEPVRIEKMYHPSFS